MYSVAPLSFLHSLLVQTLFREPLSERTSPCGALCLTAPVRLPTPACKSPVTTGLGLLLWGQQSDARGNPLPLLSLPPATHPHPSAAGILQEAARAAPFAAPHPTAGWEAATQRGKGLCRALPGTCNQPSLARGWESQGGWRELPCGSSGTVRKRLGEGIRDHGGDGDGGSHFSISPHPHSDLLSLPCVVGLRARRWSPVLSLHVRACRHMYINVGWATFLTSCLALNALFLPTCLLVTLHLSPPLWSHRTTCLCPPALPQLLSLILIGPALSRERPSLYHLPHLGHSVS